MIHYLAPLMLALPPPLPLPTLENNTVQHVGTDKLNWVKECTKITFKTRGDAWTACTLCICVEQTFYVSFLMSSSRNEANNGLCSFFAFTFAAKNERENCTKKKHKFSFVIAFYMFDNYIHMRWCGKWWVYIGRYRWIR